MLLRAGMLAGDTAIAKRSVSNIASSSKVTIPDRRSRQINFQQNRQHARISSTGRLDRSTIASINAPSPLFLVRRSYASTPTRKFSSSDISEQDYHAVADGVLDSLTDYLETLVDEYDAPEASTYEVECASGVLNLRLGQHGTYVINKQPPNKQIWLSSPRSGPKRFDYDEQQKAWFMLKDGEEWNMRDILDGELSDVFGQKVEVRLSEDE